MRRIAILLSIIFIALIVPLGSMIPARAQSTAPQLLKEFTVDGSSNVKFPGVAAVGSAVFLSGGVNSSDAVVWTMTEQATNSGLREVVGAARGQADYATVSVTATADGSAYAIWSSISDGRIYMRQRSSTGVWGAVRTVTSGGFPIFPQIAVTSNGQIFAIWIDLGVPLRLAVSSDGGASWSGPYLTSEGTYSVPPTINVGANNQVVIGFTTVNLRPAVAIWTGANLTTEVIPVSIDMADASASIGPDGKIYAVWRGIDDSGVNSGIFHAERLGTNSWSSRQLVAGAVKGTVNIKIDSSGTQHLGWITNISGGQRFHYTFRQSGQAAFLTPAHTNVSGAFNSRLALSSDGAYAHGVMEDFGGGLHTTYARFLGGTSPLSAKPLIEGGAASVGGKTTASVSFTDVNGVNQGTTQVRWRWNAAPTTTANDSGGWQTFTNPITVPIPTAILASTSCTASTLYTQLRDTPRGVGETIAQNDSILVDGVIQGVASVRNPYIDVSSSLSGSDSLAADLALSKGATGAGDPNYTRVALLDLIASGNGDCTGISSVAIGKTTAWFDATYKIDSNSYTGLIPLPDLANLQTGPWPVVVRLYDGVGNNQDFSFPGVTFDDLAPTYVSANTPVPTSNPHGDILQNLVFDNVVVNDTTYSYVTPYGNTRHFWGVWLANSTNPAVADPINSLTWAAVPVSDVDSDTVIVRDWSLATGLSTLPTPGVATNYYIYVRFLDGAGNATGLMPSPIAVLNNLSQPVQMYLPTLRK